MQREVKLKALYKSEKLVSLGKASSRLSAKEWFAKELFESLKKRQRFSDITMDKERICIDYYCGPIRIYFFTCKMMLEEHAGITYVRLLFNFQSLFWLVIVACLFVCSFQLIELFSEPNDFLTNVSRIVMIFTIMFCWLFFVNKGNESGRIIRFVEKAAQAKGTNA